MRQAGLALAILAILGVNITESRAEPPWSYRKADLRVTNVRIQRALPPPSDRPRSLSPSVVSSLIEDVEQTATRARNEGQKVSGFFQGWQEKGNQVDQQLSAVLRTMKDVRRIGVGGNQGL